MSDSNRDQFHVSFTTGHITNTSLGMNLSSTNTSITMADNSSASNMTSSEQKDWTMAPVYILAISNTLSVLGVLLNIPHVIILIKMPIGKYLGARNNRKLLVAVAALDIVVSVVKVPLDYEEVQLFLDRTTWFCAFTAVWGYAAHLSSEGMLMLGCVDRLIIIKSPATYSSTWLARNFGKVLTIPIIWNFGYIIVFLAVTHKKILGPRGFSICYLDVSEMKPLNILASFSALAPVFITFILYYIICCVMRHADMSRHARSVRFSYRVATYIFTTMAVTLVAWAFAPLNLILTGLGKFNIVIFYMGPLMVFTSAIIHPIMYGIAVPNYRNYIKRSIGLNTGRRRVNTVGPAGQIDDSST